jgi:hypothetical protein
MPLETPEPSSNVTLAALLKLGITWPLAVRGDSVTFVPPDEVYTKNMFAPDMPLPWPRATHSYELGAEIWKNTSPVPEDAVLAGMLSLKQTLVEGQTLAT